MNCLDATNEFMDEYYFLDLIKITFNSLIKLLT